MLENQIIEHKFNLQGNLESARHILVKIEKGVEHPSEMLLLFICSMYGCSIEWLKSGIGESRKEPEDLEDALLAIYKKNSLRFYELLYKLPIGIMYDTTQSIRLLIDIAKILLN